METSFITERKIISWCFNPIRDSVFILSIEAENKLSLTEEDLSKNIIFHRFKLLKHHECQIQNTNYKQLPKDTYEGYSIYFWEWTSKIFVIYPFGYISIFDYNTTQLLYHFQCHGKKAYVIRNIVGSPVQKSIFFSAQNMRNVYHIDYESWRNGINFQKLILPPNEIVFDLICHPNEKFVFIASSDSIIHIFDYSFINKIKEVRNGIVDIPWGPAGIPQKNQAELIKKHNLQGVITIDINATGNFWLSGNENGTIYLWDAFLAMKEKRILYNKEHISCSGILSLKFLRTKQFKNMERFICLTKEGKFFIYFIIQKDPNSSYSNTTKGEVQETPTTQPQSNITKSYSFTLVYENSTYNPVIYPLTKYILITSSLINISYFSNVIALTWPNLKIERIKNGDKSEAYLLFTNFSSKFFFIYDDDYPKINFPLSLQLSFRPYEDYIPTKKQIIFENRVWMLDSFFIYIYDIITGNTKKVYNYVKEFNLKNVYPLKFEYQFNQNDNEYVLFILIENEFNKKYILVIIWNALTNIVKKTEKFEDIIDVVILGLTNSNSDYAFMIHKDKQNGILYSIKEGTKQSFVIDASVVRVYHTPFNDGYCVLYRNVLNELKFSENWNTSDKLAFKCINDNQFKLDFSEREIDVVFTNNCGDGRVYCAISMIEKLLILDENMKIMYTYKTSLSENPNIISSIFWWGKTLLYSKGNSINYYYGNDNIHQKIFTNNRDSTFIAGVLPDRLLLVSRDGKDIDNVVLTTPVINPLEPIWIGYWDISNIDYNLVRECVVNMFTNQISQNWIDKFISKDWKEVAWMFISDSKSSFQNINIKIRILNDLLQFDKVLENILVNKDWKNEMHLDELIWKWHYDQSIDYIQNILKNEVKILIRFAQFDKAVKILELLGEYPKALNWLLLSTSKEEYEKLRVMFQAKGCLSFSDNWWINNVFSLKYKPDENNLNNMKHYNKVFDKDIGEHFIFGANQEKFKVNSIKNVENKINKKNSYITGISKKILSFGESSFAILSNTFNSTTETNEIVSICTVVMQKIEQFYGTKNTVLDSANTKTTKKPDFQDYNVSLNQLQTDFQKTEDDMNITSGGDNGCGDDIEDNINIEDINETTYLSAYYHCDKGSGTVLEDITENANEGIITYIEPQINPDQSVATNWEQIEEEDVWWSNVWDEFEPLEYEDKWGRKSPGAHSIKFKKKNKTKWIIKSTPSLLHLNKKFSIELWWKLNSFNVTVLTKDTISIEIQNGEFKLNNQNNILQGDKVKDYTLPLSKYVHVTFTYHKKHKQLTVNLNCERVITFPIWWDSISSSSSWIIGNENWDAEITELKIWNQEMPMAYLKDNYKSPLPILAENKRKLKMKINKQDDNQPKKKFEFNKSTFVFGNKGTSSTIAPFNNAMSVISSSSNNNINTVNSNKGMYDFNPGEFNNININNDFENSVAYPSFTSVMDDTKSVATISGRKGEIGDQNLEFGFKFDEINDQNFDINTDAQNQNNAFNFQVNDINFDK